MTVYRTFCIQRMNWEIPQSLVRIGICIESIMIHVQCALYFMTPYELCVGLDMLIVNAFRNIILFAL